MNKKAVFLLLMIILLGMAVPAQESRRWGPNLLGNLKFDLLMAEKNLFEARFILRLKGEIELTAAQVQKIENLMLANEENAIRRGSDIKVLELKFASLLKGNRIDRRQMEKLARDIGGKSVDLKVDYLNYLLDVRDTLTSEQVQKLEKIKETFRSAMRKHMEKKGRLFPPRFEDDDPGGMEEEPPLD
ncbi:MAG: hypothetical protein JXO51_06590 [Candidatus Aminicenantes bacterium]|nr:hypothetical protein [Candidatus Aminicenantes bacterium]